MPIDQEKFARLMALSKIHEAQIKANPIPFLNAVVAENAALREGIEYALTMLAGFDNFDLAQEIAPLIQPSMVETAVARNMKAASLLRDTLVLAAKKRERN